MTIGRLSSKPWFLASEPKKKKLFVFTIEALCEIKGYVYADDIDEATELVESKEWEEIEDTKIEEVEDLVNIHEEED